jgi:hypothetical protein
LVKDSEIQHHYPRDVVKDKALSHFICHLSWGLPSFQSNPASLGTAFSLEDSEQWQQHFFHERPSKLFLFFHHDKDY